MSNWALRKELNLFFFQEIFASIGKKFLLKGLISTKL